MVNVADLISRRTFVKAASSIAGIHAVNSLPGMANAREQLISVTTPLSLFGYADVQLHDGPMRRQFEENHARFLNLDDDRMLKVFRQVAGLPAPGEDMGGWYDLAGFSLERNDFHGFIAGHSFGQYVSGLARAYAVTADESTGRRSTNLLRDTARRSTPKQSSSSTTDSLHTPMTSSHAG